MTAAGVAGAARRRLSALSSAARHTRTVTRQLPLPGAETAEPRAGTPRRRLPVARLIAALVVTLAMALALLPDLVLGLDTHSPFAQLQAFRQWTLLGAGGLVLLLVLITLRWRWWWPFTAGALAVTLVAAALVLPRAIPDPAPAAGTPLTVLSFNTFEGEADIDALAAVIRDRRPDLVSLPESGDDFRDRLAERIEPLGYQVRSSIGSRVSDVNGVTAAAAPGLGSVSFEVRDDTVSFPYLVVSGGTLGQLRFVAFHSVAPTLRSTPFWRHDLGLLPQYCAGPTPVIVAGDFNATLDHSLLRTNMAGCGDAAAQRGGGLIPTWGPTATLRRTVGPQIDHVLASDGIAASAFEVIDIPGSDHRAILATLQVR